MSMAGRSLALRFLIEILKVVILAEAPLEGAIEGPPTMRGQGIMFSAL
jgi:hypothetical protein